MVSRVAIFDFDGTLLRTDRAIKHCILHVLNGHGFSSAMADKLNHLISTGTTLKITFLKLGISDESVDLCIKQYREIYKTEGDALSELFPNVYSTLALSRKMGYKNVVLSNKGIDAVRRGLLRFELDKVVDLIVGESAGIAPKPNPDIYEKIISTALAIDNTEKVYVVGDTAADIQFAKNIAAKSCWVTYGFGNIVECTSLAPQFTLNSIEELIAKLT